MMNKPVHILVFAIMLSAAWACQGGNDKEVRKDGFSNELKTREDSLFHDVMEGHDAGMARMNLISKYLKKTREALDSLQNLPIEKVDVLYQQDLVDLQEDLNYAQYGMNTWMDEFKIDSAKGNTELREKYLQSERDKINKVKEAILNSLQRADSLFNKP